jgi:hypothetical protein
MLPFVENRTIFVAQGARRSGWLLHNAAKEKLAMTSMRFSVPDDVKEGSNQPFG